MKIKFHTRLTSAIKGFKELWEWVNVSVKQCVYIEIEHQNELASERD